MALSNPTSDAIGQHCATLKVTGDNDPTEQTIYFAVRTTGPYMIGDGDDIRSGIGSVAATQQPNMIRTYALFTDLDSEVTHYWGAVKATGDAVVGNFTTVAEPVPEEVDGIYPPAAIDL